MSLTLITCVRLNAKLTPYACAARWRAANMVSILHAKKFNVRCEACRCCSVGEGFQEEHPQSRDPRTAPVKPSTAPVEKSEHTVKKFEGVMSTDWDAFLWSIGEG